MRKLVIVLIAVIGLASCTKEPVNIWNQKIFDPLSVEDLSMAIKKDSTFEAIYKAVSTKRYSKLDSAKYGEITFGRIDSLFRAIKLYKETNVKIAEYKKIDTDYYEAIYQYVQNTKPKSNFEKNIFRDYNNLLKAGNKRIAANEYGISISQELWIESMVNKPQVKKEIISDLRAIDPLIYEFADLKSLEDNL